MFFPEDRSPGKEQGQGGKGETDGVAGGYRSPEEGYGRAEKSSGGCPESPREVRKLDLEKAMENVPMGSEEREKFDQAMKIFEDSRGMRSYRSSGEPFIFTPGVEFYGRHFGEDTERTTWEFSKYIKESSLSRSYTIDVEPTVNSVVMAVIGDCKVGEIRIKILMPNNKVYSDVLIDESGNLNWRKSFTISDTENKDKAGAWKFEIDASKASGYFKISLQTY